MVTITEQNLSETTTLTLIEPSAEHVATTEIYRCVDCGEAINAAALPVEHDCLSAPTFKGPQATGSL
jgi:hypothetical protein